MKKRLASKIGAAVLAASMMMSMAAPAMAATTYTPVAGTSCNFNKYLIMDAGDTVPNVSFDFTVAAGTAVSADTSDNQYMQVLPGIVLTENNEVTSPSIATVTFDDEDTTSTTSTGLIDVNRTASERGVANGATGPHVQLDSGQKFATQQATVSFSGITFPEPGIYRYIISETADATHAAAGITHDDDSDRVLDVYVTDNGSGTLVVSGYVLHTTESNPAIGSDMGSDDVQAAGDALADKTDGFTNEMTGRKDLQINKAVSGNQASRDKWFKLTATLTGVNASDTFVVSIANDSDANTNDGNADATSGTTAATKAANQGQTNATSVTGTELLAGKDFYLQHGQSVVIRGLPLNAVYTLTEDAEDYASAQTTGMTNTGTIGTVAGENKVAQAGFTNTRNGVIPTGVMMAVAPFAIATLIGGAGVATMSMKKRKKEEDE